MFANSKFKSVIFSNNFDTSNVEDMSCMFSFCPNLKELDLKMFKIDNCTSIKHMFTCCVKLAELDISNFKPHEKLTSICPLFFKCSKLKNLTFDDRGDLNLIWLSYKYKDLNEEELLAKFDIKK